MEAFCSGVNDQMIMMLVWTLQVSRVDWYKVRQGQLFDVTAYSINKF